MSRVTQKTIARQLGLSPSLVSRALAGKAAEIGASMETVHRIVETARTMGYVPSAVARQLRGKGGRVIGVVIADMGDPFFGQVMTEVIRQSHHRGCALAVTGFDRRMVDHRDISVLLEQHLDGLLIIGGGPMEWMKQTAVQNLKLARIGPVQKLANDFFQIGSDEEEGFRQLVRHLASLGHRHIGLVGAGLEVHRKRLQLARTIARKAGMTCPDRHVVVGSNRVLEAGLEGGNQLIDQAGSKLPTAVICSSDTVAMGVIGVLSARGIRVPHDMSVTGFDDLMLSRLTSPPLTTLHQPLSEITRHALDAIIDGQRKAKVIRLPLTLITRSSTGKVERTLPSAHTFATQSGLGTNRSTITSRTQQIIIMGVSGCGKSTVGKALARKLGRRFIEGDEFHPESNIRKMSRGQPLTDEDRWPWLDVLHRELQTATARGESIVLACSALRQVYRDRLTGELPCVRFVYLKGDRETLRRNLNKRKGHFMKTGLLESQLRTLEEPTDAMVITCDTPIRSIVETVMGNLHEN